MIQRLCHDEGSNCDQPVLPTCRMLLEATFEFFFFTKSFLLPSLQFQIEKLFLCNEAHPQFSETMQNVHSWIFSCLISCIIVRRLN